MADENIVNSNLNLGYILSLLTTKKFVNPTNFHEQADAVEEMFDDESSGLIDSLTDLAVNTASVDFTIETDSEGLNTILKQWFTTLNAPYVNTIPVGIKSLAREYFRERWKGASFPILKILDWKKIKGFNVPAVMSFVDGGSVYAEEKISSSTLSLDNYIYYLGKDKKDKLTKGVIITKPFSRWSVKYPKPFLIKRGTYKNWAIINALKNNQLNVLEQIIPYLMVILKGSERLATDRIKKYSQTELTEIKEKIQTLMTKLDNKKGIEFPIRVTQFDEEIKHLIPDLINLFKEELFFQAERAILSGLGFIEIIEGVGTSRRDAILNPKVFIEEVKQGVEDFKQILFNLLIIVLQANKKHKTYAAKEYLIHSSPTRGFLTAELKEQIRKAYERGTVSKRTYDELCPEVDFNTEKFRRMTEIKNGDEELLYPQHILNNEEKQSVEELTRRKIFKGADPEKTPEKKRDNKNAENANDFVASSVEDINDLITAPYVRLTDLPDWVKEKHSLKYQRIWLSAFNNSYKFYLGKYGDKKKADALAFQTASAAVKKAKKKAKRTKKK